MNAVRTSEERSTAKRKDWERGAYARTPSPEEKKRRRLSRALKKADEARLSPRTIARLRADIAQAVSEQLVDAHDVVMGRNDKTWTATQARVFGILINKVIPDLHASYVKKEDDDDRPLEDISRDDLERIVAGMAKIEAKKAPGSHRRNPEDIPDAEVIYADEDED